MKNPGRLLMAAAFFLTGTFALAGTAGGSEPVPSYYPWLGMLMAILASANLNVGKGVQKWKVRVLGKGRAMFRRENLGDLGIWMIGFVLTASAVPLFSFALNFTTKPSQVSSLNGVGMIGLVLFAEPRMRAREGDSPGACEGRAQKPRLCGCTRPVGQDARDYRGRRGGSGLLIPPEQHVDGRVSREHRPHPLC